MEGADSSTTEPVPWCEVDQTEKLDGAVKRCTCSTANSTCMHRGLGRACNEVVRHWLESSSGGVMLFTT